MWEIHLLKSWRLSIYVRNTKCHALKIARVDHSSHKMWQILVALNLPLRTRSKWRLGRRPGATCSRGIYWSYRVVTLLLEAVRDKESKRQRDSFSAPVLILNVYRPPSSNAETDTSLAICIEKVVAQNKECFVLGDFNINTLYVTSPSNRLLKSIHSLGLSQMADKPTRGDVNSSTKGLVTSTSLIDQIYVSQGHNIVEVHLSDVTLSDHYPVFVIRRCNAGLLLKKECSYYYQL